MRDWHAMREAWIDLQLSPFNDLCGECPSICKRNDLIVIAVHHQRRYIDLIEIFGEVGFRECLDTVIMPFDPTLHSLIPEIRLDTLRDLCTGAVIAEERQSEVLVVLRSVIGYTRPYSIKDIKLQTAGILIALEHDRGNRRNQHCL